MREAERRTLDCLVAGALRMPFTANAKTRGNFIGDGCDIHGFPLSCLSSNPHGADDIGHVEPSGGIRHAAWAVFGLHLRHALFNPVRDHVVPQDENDSGVAVSHSVTR